MSTPDIQDVRVLQLMVDTMVGIPRFTYPARQREAEKPADEFAHVRVIEEYQVGIPTQTILSQTDDETIFRTISAVRIRCRIGVVDTTGIPSSKIMHGWTSEAMKQIMIDTGYGFVRCTPLSSEDAKLEKEWEYRKGFSVEFYTTRVYDETVNNITAVTINGAFYDFIDTYLSTIEINNI